MKKSHWALLVLSAILYALPFLWSEQLWWLVFVFPIPLLYLTRTQNLSFIHGYVWGVIVFLLHLSGGIFVVANLAHESWLIGVVLGISMVLYQALVPALLFWGTTMIVRFFLAVTQFIRFAPLNRIFFRARPELVEGYLRALGDILQQVQDERGIRFQPSHYSGLFPLIRVFMWTGALALFIFWTDQYCLWIFGIQEGYPLMHPLLPLMQQPCLLLLLPIVGKQVVTIFFLLVPSSFVLLLWYKNATSLLLCASTIIPWLLCFLIGVPEKKHIKKKHLNWYGAVKSLPCMTRSCVDNPIITVKIIGSQLKKIIEQYPQTEVIIMPESAFNVSNFADLPELLQLWDGNHLGKPIHLIFGACRWHKGNYYNSLHWVYNGVLQTCFDKKHAMLITERLSEWMNNDIMRQIYFKNGAIITRSLHDRIILNISEDIAFVPYICSELFFNELPDDHYDQVPIVAIINDTLLSGSYLQELVLLLARFKAMQWQRDIVYVSYGWSLFIDKWGGLKGINE